MPRHTAQTSALNASIIAAGATETTKYAVDFFQKLRESKRGNKHGKEHIRS